MSTGTQLRISGLVGSQTTNNREFPIRSTDLFLDRGLFADGVLTVSSWQRHKPFKGLIFQFDLINPSTAQIPKKIYVSVSGKDLSIPASKALGEVLGSSVKVSDLDAGNGLGSTLKVVFYVSFLIG